MLGAVTRTSGDRIPECGDRARRLCLREGARGTVRVQGAGPTLGEGAAPCAAHVLAGRPVGARGGYLVVPSPDVQNVPLGDRPVEGETRHGIAKGERVLAVGDPGDIDGHLQGERQACDDLGPLPGTSCRSGPEHSQAQGRGASSDKAAKDGADDRTSPPVLEGPDSMAWQGPRCWPRAPGGVQLGRSRRCAGPGLPRRPAGTLPTCARPRVHSCCGAAGTPTEKHTELQQAPS